MTEAVMALRLLAIDPDTQGGNCLAVHLDQVCDRVAGRYMHHLPIMDEDIRSGQASERGLAAMRATGYRVDLEWWTDGESCCPENCAQPPHTA
ncbi:hypothetical protein AGRA3207_005972 [Actinomadura graeca]|uniref:Uncharacterized protein n=1 Tax=Actinomadura graeca TaxID=2750812 RepID=A0ABX8R143_9ACTN|nr:hypothetical protein [Actinomadura graeca]QXJ24613.1 hypothetical protein AGRA3207_005972 [Actinomadura graeca]